MDFDTKFIFSYLYMLIIVVIQAEECIKIDACSCSVSGHKIDLRPLVNNLNPRFSVDSGPYTYKFQPCIGLTSGCADSTEPVAVCQTLGTAQYNAGYQPSAKFSGDPALNTLQVQYIGGPLDQTPVRSSTISLVCDSSIEGNLAFINETPVGSGHFIFSLTTKYACTNPSPSPAKEKHGLSTGSVLLILFFVFLAVYFIGGILFLKFMRGAQGTEMIPNYEFWTDLPGLIKEGVMFTCRGCKTDSSYSQI